MADSRELGLFIPPEKVAEIEQERQIEQERRGKIKRRLAFRYLGWGAILALIAEWSAGFLYFFYPQKVGAFGGVVNAGNIPEFEVGDVKVVREGKFYVTRVPEGFMALWWKCPHLGCTVPWKENDPVMGGPPGQGDIPFAEAGRFNCPCHGSIYNRYGQIVQGPAPRPMDRFPIEFEGTRIMVNTGRVITRPVATLDDVAVPPA